MLNIAALLARRASPSRPSVSVDRVAPAFPAVSGPGALFLDSSCSSDCLSEPFGNQKQMRMLDTTGRTRPDQCQTSWLSEESKMLPYLTMLGEICICAHSAIEDLGLQLCGVVSIRLPDVCTPYLEGMAYLI